MFKIFIADAIAPAVTDFLAQQKDCEVTTKVGLSEAELIKAIPDFDALIVRSATTVTAKIIAAGKKLKLIGRAGAGIDNIDKKAASAAGILVVNAPTGNLISVAELVFGHIFAAFRQLAAADTSTKAGKWEKKKLGKLGRELDGKTIGIVGLGKIGQLVAERARGFNLKVLAYDPIVTAEAAEQAGAQLVDLTELLRKADVITLHVPLIPQTKNLISTKQFKIMRPDALLINCARGGVVDEKALAVWLRKNKTALAVLDTFVKEPVAKTNPLLQLPNFFTTPHLGASTAEAQTKVGLQLADQVVRALRGEIVEFVVNLPFRASSNLPDQKAWNELAEKIARLAAQILAGSALKKAELTVAGEIATEDSKLLQVSVLKGLLETLSAETNINFVNAIALAQKKGLKLIEKKEKKSDQFRSQLGLRLVGTNEIAEVRGTVAEGQPRITFIQDFKTNFTPGERLLLTHHRDLPGVIGRVGSLLGKHGINIASMDLGRNRIGGDALMILDVDNKISDRLLRELARFPDFAKVLRVDL